MPQNFIKGLLKILLAPNVDDKENVINKNGTHMSLEGTLTGGHMS